MKEYSKLFFIGDFIFMVIRSTLLCALSLTALAGCRTSNSSEVMSKRSPEQQRSTTNQPPRVSFSKDERPVDGAFIRVFLQKNERGTYDAFMSKEIVNRQTGISGGWDPEQIAEDLKCEFSDKLISCIVDARPVDGALRELKFQANGESLFAPVTVVTLRTVIVSRQTGQSGEKIETIAEGLARELESADNPLAPRRQPRVTITTVPETGCHGQSARSGIEYSINFFPGEMKAQLNQVIGGDAASMITPMTCQMPSDGKLLDCKGDKVFRGNIYSALVFKNPAGFTVNLHKSNDLSNGPLAPRGEVEAQLKCD
jgi:hypothetical protein